MKKIFLFIIFMILKTSVYGQNYIDYYSLVNKAELNIIKSEYEKSLNLYTKAFELVKVPFSKDIYNASLCSTKIKNDSVTNVLVVKLIAKGIPLKFFKRKSYKAFRKTDYWKKLKKKEKELLEIADNKINKIFLNELIKIENLDQKIRKRKYGYPMSDTIKKVDSLNMLKLISLLDKYGYPNENNIGIENPKKVFQQPQNIVLRHFFQGQTKKVAKENFLKNRLLRALKEGKLCPIQYSVWEDMRYLKVYKKHKYGIFSVVLQNGDYRKNTLENIPEINENRRKIGIGTYDEYALKVIFQETQDEFYFGINEGIIKL